MEPRDYLLGSIEDACHLFLTNANHVSRRANTEKAIARLHQLTGQYIELMQKEAPPTLGVSVGDGIGMGEKVG